MDEIFHFIIGKYNYWASLVLLFIGLYGMIAKNNLMKKIIGMVIFQTAILLFFVSIGAKRGATVPIIEFGPDKLPLLDATAYANPLPHVLILTAIVVGVATLGVALAILQKIQRVHGTIEEDEILEDQRR
ncbi:cation:proton antiporter subunit C [Desulfurivibrio dismutans]|uniref:cation:proton antiporter subunit C n=1 Tax=Desulfurivibrio dismutans TaxID=1398908 RepID=UPI0023DA5F32|nr:cation:proton antiporter subunit C [Desulfurivibrio alkaliphilus]MDF1614291.1 cation:proton antiporter subunit C [Desulfurivibrio alkaliphilus]